MSMESFGERDAARFGLRLVGSYGRWTAAYLALVLAFWLVGFEGIWESPTPFYAYLKSAFPSFTAPGVVLAVLAVASLGWVVATQRGSAAYGVAVLALPWVALGALAYVFQGLGSAFVTVDPESRVPLSRELLYSALPWGVFAAGVAAFVAAARKLNWFEAEPSPRATAWMLFGFFVFAVAFASVVAMMRGGADGITQAYARHGSEYVDDIGITRSIRELFEQYADKHPYLSMHAKVHPPGPIVVLWIISSVLTIVLAGFLMTPDTFSMSIATIVCGSVGVVPLYFWAKDLMGKRAALTACAVYVVVPSIVLFTATSADILFMPFMFLTLFFFGRALHRGSIGYAAGAGVMYGVCSLLSFSLLSVGAYFAFMGLRHMRDRKHWFGVVLTAVVMIVAFLGLHLAVRLWSNFDVLEVFRLSKAQFDTDQANLDIYTQSRLSAIARSINRAANPR